MEQMAAAEREAEKRPLLLQTYKLICQLAAEFGGEPAEDGYTRFVPDRDLKVLVKEMLDISDYRAAKQLDTLRGDNLKAYWAKSGGQGRPWVRFVKFGMEDEVLSAAGQQRTAPPRRLLEARSGNGSLARLPIPPLGPESEERQATIEQLNSLWEKLADKLDGYRSEIKGLQEVNARLERELEQEREEHAATKRELGELRTKPPERVSVIPDAVAERLATHLE